MRRSFARWANLKWLEALLHLHDTPRRIAAAYALGVFFGFSPLLGLHTILGVAFAFALGLNRVAVLLGVYSNLPWIIAAYYTLATIVGAAILQAPIPSGLGRELEGLFALSIFSRAFWRELFDHLRPLLWPFVIGSTLGALLLAVASFWVAKTFLEARKRHAGHDGSTRASQKSEV
ncbi:MAG: DUF2062 domain-containing protein [Acidobacteria bacterium]|nr:DUF2062 domain-containing protein [Acidobacteriota bacterium]